MIALIALTLTPCSISEPEICWMASGLESQWAAFIDAKFDAQSDFSNEVPEECDTDIWISHEFEQVNFDFAEALNHEELIQLIHHMIWLAPAQCADVYITSVNIHFYLQAIQIDLSCEESDNMQTAPPFGLYYPYEPFSHD